MNNRDKAEVIDISRAVRRQQLSDTVALDKLENLADACETLISGINIAKNSLSLAQSNSVEVGSDAHYNAIRSRINQALSLIEWAEHDTTKLLEEWDRG